MATLIYLGTVNILLQAAKKGIDTVVEFAKNQDPAFDLRYFMPSGFSKVSFRMTVTRRGT
jgi:hypothetical protein